MKFTGERFLPDDYPNEDIAIEHYQRYLSIGDLVKGKTVIDVACGEGYGTCILSKAASFVYGIDIDEETVSHATQKYREIQNIKFLRGSVAYLPFRTHCVDVVVSFETIEHIDEKNQYLFLQEIKRILKQNGILIVSTPDKFIYSDSQNYTNEFHIKEFYRDEFYSFLLRYFKHVNFFYQDFQAASVFSNEKAEKLQVVYTNKLNSGQYIVAICSDAHKNILFNIGSIVYDLEDKFRGNINRILELQREVEKLVSWGRHLDTVNISKEEDLKTKQHLIDTLRHELERLRYVELEAVHLKNEHYRLSQEVSRLEQEKVELENRLSQEVSRLEQEKVELENRLSQEVSRLEQEKVEFSKLVAQHRRELDEIRNAISWRLITHYRRQVERWLPQHTRRRRFYRLCLLASIVLFKDGPAAFFRKVAARLPFGRRMNGDVTVSGRPLEGWQPLTFPGFDRVKVSIVIPVYNQSLHTFKCLQSLLEHTKIPYEVIVVDNASSVDTSQMLAAMEGIQVIRNQDNKGFVVACNQGAEAGEGNYYLFLNNDTEVTRGWLEAMLKPFEDERVGIVGAKLIYPDGRLQEAGNIIWEDGTGWNYGRGDDPDLPQYSYMKEVDYCSAACLLIRKNLWLKLGGFDHRYAPAYYEDTDLCFAARQQGYKVIYQPEARVVHYEGISAGTDINRGYKRYQKVNLDKFRGKWGEVLKSGHFTGPEELYLARERGFSKRVLVVDHYVPTFDMDSGSLRMFSLVKIFRDLGYKVIFWPENRAFHEPYTRELQKMGIETLYGDINFEEYLKSNGQYIDLILLSRPHVAVNFMDAAKTLTNARIMYDTVDLHFVREERRARLEAEKKARLEAEKSAREWKSLELFLAHQADETLVVSPVEKEILEREGLEGRVSVISNVHALESCYNSFEQREGLMFIGGFVHPPNEDGIVWFVELIFPSIQKKLSGIHLYIVGSHPTDKVRSLSSSNVTVTGYVKDVSPYFEKARVFVTPMRYGAGLKGKIGQSMAYGLPVVTTSIGAEGMGLADGYNVLIADDEEQFANKVVEVYHDRRLWETLSLNARTLIEQNYSPDAVKQALGAVLEKNDSR